MQKEDIIFGTFFACLIVAAFMLVLVPIYKVASADGRADFCYVKAYTATSLPYSPDGKPTQVWDVQSHRPWRDDMDLGIGRTPEEARAIADRFGCRFHTEK